MENSDAALILFSLLCFLDVSTCSSAAILVVVDQKGYGVLFVFISSTSSSSCEANKALDGKNQEKEKASLIQY